MTAFRVSYDDSIVKFYDAHGREIGATTVSIQRCKAEEIDFSNGINPIRLRDGMMLITDGRSLGSIDQGRSYRWYAKTSALAKAGVHMNTAWKPSYGVIDGGKFVFHNLDDTTNLVVVANLDVVIALKKVDNDVVRRGLTVMPLLDAMINIDPMLSCKSLKTICVDHHGQYEDWMEFPERVMSDLFEAYKEKFNVFSQNEACSFGELHDCLFENMLRISLTQRPTSSLGYDGTSSSFLRDRMMFVKSGYLTDNCCGDIAWYLARDEETAPMRAVSTSYPVTVFNNVYAFVSDKSGIRPKSRHIKYSFVFIFPAIDVEGRHYAYGSFLAMHPNSQVDFYGSLFEDLSPREEFYIDFLFSDHVNGNLKRETNPGEYFRRRQMPTRCRHALVDKIKECFLANKKAT